MPLFIFSGLLKIRYDRSWALSGQARAENNLLHSGHAPVIKSFSIALSNPVSIQRSNSITDPNSSLSGRRLIELSE